MNYTKGPWEYCDGGIFGPWDDEKDESPLIADVKRCGMNGPHTQEGYANAQLLKAAPELYEALKALEVWWRKPNDQRTIASIEAVVTSALDAIAKAEGR